MAVVHKNVRMLEEQPNAPAPAASWLPTANPAGIALGSTPFVAVTVLEGISGDTQLQFPLRAAPLDVQE